MSIFLYHSQMGFEELNLIVAEFEKGKAPVPQEIPITLSTAESWVRFKIDPKRFLPSIFEGDWAFTQQHPNPGFVRLVRAMTGTDGITRLIARQGKYIYAYPWFK